MASRKILVKPNFIEDPFDTATTVHKDRGYGLYVGLSEEKGNDILLDAGLVLTFL
jgi:hypothetical protein